MDGITHFVSFALAQRHFAVFLYYLEERAVIVYDGLHKSNSLAVSYHPHPEEVWVTKFNESGPCRGNKGQSKDKILKLCFDDLYQPLVVLRKRQVGVGLSKITCW